MGNFVSAPVNTNAPAVLNFILREMFRRADLIDIYSLADKDRCSRYVVAGADALEQLFIKINVHPERGKDGALYFQSLDGLRTAMPRALVEKQRTYCIELSFFFIRIFQIFGALTLSMFDTTIPVGEPVEVIPVKAAATQSKFLQSSNFFKAPPPPRSSWFGGALTDASFYIRDGSYKILNYHLYKPEGGLQSREPMRMEGFPLFIAQDGLYTILADGKRTVEPDPHPKILYSYVRNSSTFTLTATINISGLDPEYTVQLANFTSNGNPSPQVTTRAETLKSYAGEKPSSLGNGYPETRGKPLPAVLATMFDDAATKILGPVTFTPIKFLRQMRYLSGTANTDSAISGTHIFFPGSQENSTTPRIIFRDSTNLGGAQQKTTITIRASVKISEPKSNVLDGSYSYSVTIDFSNVQVVPPEAQQILDFKQYRTANFIAYSATSPPKSERTDMTIPQYLESTFQAIIQSKDESGNTGIRYTRAGLPKPYNSDNIPEDLRIKTLWGALAKDPPIKSHCVARAVQLLSVDAMRGNMTPQAFSSVCRLTFPYQKDGSLPMPNQKVSSEVGLHSLATLFWNQFEQAMPTLQDSDSYKRFLQFLQSTMGKDSSIQPGKMSDIKEKADSSICTSERADTRLKLPNNLARTLKGVTDALIDQQSAHINEAMNIIYMLFDMDSITNSKIFAFNPNIMAGGGMPEIERIAGLARKLLMNYYQGCEITYQSGLKIISDYNKVESLVAVKLDGTAVAPIPIAARSVLQAAQAAQAAP